MSVLDSVYPLRNYYLESLAMFIKVCLAVAPEDSRKSAVAFS